MPLENTLTQPHLSALDATTKPVALEFEDVEDYINSWTPLFLTEIKSQINRECLMEKEDSEKFVLEAIDEKVPFRYMTLMRKEGENKFYKIHDFALITYYEVIFCTAKGRLRSNHSRRSNRKKI